MIVAVLAVLLAAGCTSTPEKETSNQSTTITETQAKDSQNDSVKVPITEPQSAVRYVELTLTSGDKVGGRFVSETPAFVTIVPLYVISKGFETLSPGSGEEVATKVDYIATMVNIEESAFNATMDKLAAS